jgi:dethiobiotin synthetase
MTTSTYQTTRPGGFFITGTDTEIGKTHIACCIAQGLIAQGISVTARKPIASGCVQQADGTLISEDAVRLQQACQTSDTLDTLCRYRFQPAISPARASQQMQPALDLAQLMQACQINDNRFALIEGAGGFLSPLTHDALNADLAKALGYPLILVVGNRLGCLNHALLTIEAIEARGLTLHTLVMNDLSPDSDLDNLHDLCRLTGHPIAYQPFHPQGKVSPLIVTP